MPPRISEGRGPVATGAALSNASRRSTTTIQTIALKSTARNSAPARSVPASSQLFAQSGGAKPPLGIAFLPRSA